MHIFPERWCIPCDEFAQGFVIVCPCDGCWDIKLKADWVTSIEGSMLVMRLRFVNILQYLLAGLRSPDVIVGKSASGI